MLVGLVLAGLAMLSTGVGSVVESVGVKQAATRLDAKGRPQPVAANGVYLLGLLIDLGGFLLAMAAMQYLPLFVVQAAVAGSVGVTAAIAARLGAGLSMPAIGALVVMVVGLVLLGVSAAPGRAQALPTLWAWLLPATAVPLAVLAWFGARLRVRRIGAILLAFTAGLGFSVVAIASRTLEVPPTILGWFVSSNLLAIVLTGALATVCFALALQRGSVTLVAAINFATETVLPSAVGLLFLHDRVRPDFGIVAGVGFVAAVGGAILLAHYADLEAGDAPPAAVQPLPA